MTVFFGMLGVMPVQFGANKGSAPGSIPLDTANAAVLVAGTTVIVLLLVFSFPLGTAFGLLLRTGILVSLVLPFMGLAIVRDANYLESRLTRGLWFVRTFFVVGFMLFQMWAGALDVRSLVSLVAFLGASLAFELGFLVQRRGHAAGVLQGARWAIAISAVVVLGALAPILASGGTSGLFLRVDAVREWIPLWPNHWGALVAALAVGVYAFKQGRILIPLGLVACTVILSLSRTAMVTFAVLFTLRSVIRWRRGQGRAFDIAAVTILVIASLVVIVGKESAGQVIGSNAADTSFDARRVRWEATWDAWKQSPLIGYGFKPYTDVVPTVEEQHGTAATGSSHNDVLDLVARTGLLGSVPFFAWVIAVLRAGFRGSFTWVGGAPMAAATIVVAGTLLAMMFLNPLKQGEMLLLFWTATGFIAAGTSRKPLGARGPEGG